jgi:soluble lytic murein transglycosylase-like protein
MYFLSGDDANARAMAARAATGSGEWANQARWIGALAAWRSRDWAAAESGFVDVAARAGNTDLRAAAFYWASRAAFAGGHPERVQQRLTVAAQAGDSFYGQLARQGMLLHVPVPVASGPVAGDWAALANRPNVRVAAALTEIDETDLADRVVRQQARIGAPAEFSHLVHLAEALDLPATTVWLAHNSPAGVAPAAEARFPTPNWAPDKGWRVERALVYAHTLEESGFRQKATSRAGAFGLMQIMPSAATDFARENGATVASTDWRAALARPSLNMEVGQRHLERLRDMTSITGGLLPKVIAAYNAGPKPVADWNTSVRDGGDPLLYIESIPYWETRGYVTTVLRNYWMYEAKSGRATLPSRSALAQGMWPRFPGLPGTSAVRLDARPSAAAIAVNAPIDPRTGAAIRSE